MLKIFIQNGFQRKACPSGSPAYFFMQKCMLDMLLGIFSVQPEKGFEIKSDIVIVVPGFFIIFVFSDIAPLRYFIGENIISELPEKFFCFYVKYQNAVVCQRSPDADKHLL